MSASPLLNEVVRLSTLRETAREKLMDCLGDEIPGKKIVIIDRSLQDIPSALVPVLDEFHSEFEVERPILILDHPPVSTHEAPFSRGTRNVVFIIRPRLALVNVVIKQIQHLESNSRDAYQFWVLCVPCKTDGVEELLKDAGLRSPRVRVRDLDISFVPLDDDVISMEHPGVFRELYCDGDFSLTFDIAMSLNRLQGVLGDFRCIRGKGRYAKIIVEQMQRLRADADAAAGVSSLGSGAGGSGGVASEMDTLLVLDRTIDLATPLLTQLTYEGLIDEAVGIKHGFARFPFDHTKDSYVAPPFGAPVPNHNQLRKLSQPVTGRTHTALLTFGDRFFSELRDLNWARVFIFLNAKARELSAEQQDLQTKNTTGSVKLAMMHLKQASSYMEEKRLFEQHIRIGEYLKCVTDMIEFGDSVAAEQAAFIHSARQDALPRLMTLIRAAAPLRHVLRLLCLISITAGLNAKLLQPIKREIVLVYGVESLLAMKACEDAGLLVCTDRDLLSAGVALLRNAGFNSIRDRMRLCPPDLSEDDPRDVSYAYSGIAPLSVRYVEIALRNGWAAASDVLQTHPSAEYGAETLRVPPPTRTIVVFMVGGITYSEMSALRFLQRLLEEASPPPMWSVGAVMYTHDSSLTIYVVIALVRCICLDLSTFPQCHHDFSQPTPAGVSGSSSPQHESLMAVR